MHCVCIGNAFDDAAFDDAAMRSQFLERDHIDRCVTFVRFIQTGVVGVQARPDSGALGVDFGVNDRLLASLNLVSKF